MRPVFRRLCLTAAGVVCLAGPTVAADGSRYALSASRDGFVRLDTVTGAVSHCRQDAGVWRCEPIAAEDAATSAKLDALAAQVARLTAALAALDARVAALAPVGEARSPAPVAVTESPPPPKPDGPGLVSQLVGRFLDLVRALKHGREVMPAAT